MGIKDLINQRKTEFSIARIPTEAEEALMGAFAIKLARAHVAILYHDGAAFIVSLLDYTGDAENLSRESNIEPTRDDIESPQSYLQSRQKLALYLNTATVPGSILKLRTAAPLSGHDALGKDMKF